MSDSTESTVQNSVVSNFINHVFDIGDESKKDMLNIIQFSVLAIIPLIALNKSIHAVIPEASGMKGSLELGLEVLGQTTLMLVGLVLIQRIVTFIPTYSGDEYKTNNLITVILPFLMIILSLQTKMGEKCNILYKRAVDTWNGRRGFENFEGEEGSENEQGNTVTTSQPIATKNSVKTETAGMNPQLPPPQIQSMKESRPQIANGAGFSQGGNGVGNSQLGPNPLDSGVAAFNDGFSGGFGSAY